VRPRIRQARLEDVDELARLRWEFRIGSGTPMTRDYASFLREFQAFAADALADGARWRAWVADEDGRLVGCAWLQIVAKVPHPSRTLTERPIAYVTNMFVDPDHRSLGLGRDLLDRAIAYARERDVDGVVLWPSERSRPFYERAGFGPEPLWLPIAGD
jgi:GNAT superfamily N-acetyltransferase